MNTPRPLHMFVGAVLATLIATALGLMLFTIIGLAEGELPFTSEVWVVPLLGPVIVGGVAMMIGLPIVALLRVFARRSVLANAIGFVLFIAMAALFFGPPFAIDKGWIGVRIGFGLFGALAVAMALLVGRLAAQRVAKTPIDAPMTCARGISSASSSPTASAAMSVSE